MEFAIKQKNNNGFTLAEVLITLAIIAVVAAMTVPTLMTSTRGKEYEAAANKAMSTIANSMQMRYAMDGQTLADFPDTGSSNKRLSHLINYLTKVPDNGRVGEQPALPVVSDSTNLNTRKLKDGMVILGAFSRAYPGANGDAAYVMMDTNGEKGPTRNTSRSTPGTTAENSKFDTPKFDSEFWQGDNQNKVIIEENSNAPQDNKNPDIVVFVIHGQTGAVKPAGQRTRNILATGNAMISQ